MPAIGFTTGFIVGFGSGLVTREVARFGGRLLRPMAKSVVKGSVVAFERSKEAMARVGETFDDVVAEAQSELEPQSSRAGAEASPKPRKSTTARESQPLRTAKGAT